jgi:hypothetical protein
VVANIGARKPKIQRQYSERPDLTTNDEEPQFFIPNIKAGLSFPDHTPCLIPTQRCLVASKMTAIVQVNYYHPCLHYTCIDCAEDESGTSSSSSPIHLRIAESPTQTMSPVPIHDFLAFFGGSLLTIAYLTLMIMGT